MATIVQFTRFGGPEVLEFVEAPEPTPGSGELVVAVKAAGVNPVDSKIRGRGRDTGPITTPRRVGADGAGIITAVDAAVEGWSVGDEVIIHHASGTYASHIVVTPKQLTIKPAGVGWATAAALGVPIGTAYQSIISLGVTAGTRLLIHGGSGAVGQAAIQFARLRGARVFATTGPANVDRVRDLGAEPILYGSGLLERVRAAAPDGIDLVFDAVGTDEAIETSLALVDDPQRIGTIVVGGRAAELGIKAWSGGNPIPLTPEELALRSEAVAIAAGLIDRGEFQVQLGSSYPLAEAVAAHRESEGGHPRGKITLVP